MNITVRCQPIQTDMYISIDILYIYRYILFCPICWSAVSLMFASNVPSTLWWLVTLVQTTQNISDNIRHLSEVGPTCRRHLTHNGWGRAKEGLGEEGSGREHQSRAGRKWMNVRNHHRLRWQINNTAAFFIYFFGLPAEAVPASPMVVRTCPSGARGTCPSKRSLAMPVVGTSHFKVETIEMDASRGNRPRRRVHYRSVAVNLLALVNLAEFDIVGMLS